MKTPVLASAFVVVLMSGALADPVIFIASLHNLDYAKVACDYVTEHAKMFLDEVDSEDTANRIRAGLAECRLEPDARVLGRKLENELLNALAVALRCRGVEVYRELHPDFDGAKAFMENAAENRRIKQQHQLHWDLFINFLPGSNTYGWDLYPNKGEDDKPAGASVSGEGTTREVADQVCIVVTGQGATVH